MSEPSIREVPQSAGALNGFLTDLKKSICTIYKDVPTKEQLVKAGVIGVNNGGRIEGPGQVARVVPPSPTGVVFSSAITNVLVSFDNPNYQGHAYSEMLRGDTNSYGNAIVVQRINGFVGAHPIGPARSGYYWIRHVSINFTGPPDSQTGTLVTTGQDVAPLLQILEGNIKETHLFSTLGTRINLIDGLASVPGSVNNRVAAEATIRQNADTALSSQISTVSAANSTNAAAIQTEATARANADTALATQVTTLAAKTEGGFDSGAAYYFDSNTEGWGSTGVTLSWLSGKMIATCTNNDPILFSPVFPTPIEGGKYNKIRVAVKRLAGSGWDGSLLYATAAHAFTAGFYKSIPVPTVFSVGNSAVLEWDMSTLTVGGNDWVNSNILQIRVDLGNSSSDVFEIDWVAIGRSAPGGSVAAIQQEAATRATVDGHLSAQYSVRLELDSNGQSVVGGFGLSGTSSPTQGPRIDFGVRADRFYIAAPSGSTPLPSISPFVVQTTQQTIGGQLVPAGVYMDTAFIKNGTISTAKIADLAVDNAKIATLDAAKINTGFLSANRINAQSLTADKIDTRGLTIKDASGNIILASGTPLQSQYAAFGNSRNMVENGHYKDGLVGTTLGFTNAGQHLLGRNLNSSYTVQGEGTAYITKPGATTAGFVFDSIIRNGSQNFAVQAGKRYEFYAHLNTHRCSGTINVLWVDINGAQISAQSGNSVSYETFISSINDMPRSLGFATAPVNAKSAYVFVRGFTNGAADPYVFFSRVYFGEALVNQTEASPWSSGGGITQITSSNASTYIQDLAVDTLQIAGNAVTVPVVSFLLSEVSADNFTGFNNSRLIFTLPTINSNGSPIDIKGIIMGERKTQSSNAQLICNISFGGISVPTIELSGPLNKFRIPVDFFIPAPPIGSISINVYAEIISPTTTGDFQFFIFPNDSLQKTQTYLTATQFKR